MNASQPSHRQTSQDQEGQRTTWYEEPGQHRKLHHFHLSDLHEDSSTRQESELS